MLPDLAGYPLYEFVHTQKPSKFVTFSNLLIQ